VVQNEIKNRPAPLTSAAFLRLRSCPGPSTSGVATNYPLRIENRMPCDVGNHFSMTSSKNTSPAYLRPGFHPHPD